MNPYEQGSISGQRKLHEILLLSCILAAPLEASLFELGYDITVFIVRSRYHGLPLAATFQ